MARTNMEEKLIKGETIGKKIRAIRERRGMTRQKLFELLGGVYSYDALLKVELGKIKHPPIEIVAKIAEILDVPIEELISEGEPQLEEDLLKDPDLTILMYQAKDLSSKDKQVVLKVIKALKEGHDRERESK